MIKMQHPLQRMHNNLYPSLCLTILHVCSASIPVFRIEAEIVELNSCPQTIDEIFAANEGSKIYKFAAPSDDVHFNGCESDFDTVFTIYTQDQYNSGMTDYQVANDDAVGICGKGAFSSYLNLPYDTDYNGDYYYLVVTRYSQESHFDSSLVIEFVCGSGQDTDSLYWWYYYYYYDWDWCWWDDSYCDSETDDILRYIFDYFIYSYC